MGIDYKELMKFHQAKGDVKTNKLLRESCQKGLIKPAEFSIREAALHCITDRHGDIAGPRFVSEMRSRDGLRLLEAGSEVNTSAFSNITGQFVYSEILDNYQLPEMLWPQLVKTVQTPFEWEKIAGLGSIGDEAAVVDEGQPYPFAGFGETWIETPRTEKSGMIVPVTREAIFFDRTHQVLQVAAQVGEFLGMRKEKQVIDLVIGTTNNYKLEDTTYNTYGDGSDVAPDHAWANEHTAALVDWTDIGEAEQLFNAMTDRKNGDPLLRTPTSLIVPLALRPTANRILFNMGMTRVDTTASVVQTYREDITTSQMLQHTYNIITGPMIKARTASDIKWWIGDPRRAFRWMENFALQTQQQGDNSEAAFNRDIVMQFRADMRGIPAVFDPSWMVQSTGAS